MTTRATVALPLIRVTLAVALFMAGVEAADAVPTTTIIQTPFNRTVEG